MGAAARLVCAGWDLLRCSLPRRRIARVLLGLAAAAWLGTGSVARAHDYGDDAGDTPAAAVELDVDAAAPVLEIDRDEDWFSFVMLPEVAYTVTVSNVQLYDHGQELRDRTTVTTLATSDTLPSASSSRVCWTNAAPITRGYVGVSGSLEFTTGAYQVVVGSSFTDTDDDGLLDTWETRHFEGLGQGGTNDPDGDGCDNLCEYYLLSNPTNAASGFRITDIEEGAGGVTVTWQAATQAWYRVLATTNLAPSGTWVEVGTSYQTVPAPLRAFLDGDAGVYSQRFYRVEFVY
jgi:hypothetical protein